MKSFSVNSLHDLKAVLEAHRHIPDLRLGEILIEEDLLSGLQLKEALQTQKRRGGVHLGQILIELGWVTRDQINVALARKLGIPFVRLNGYDVASHMLSRLPADIALQYNVVPLGEIDGKLVVAMENPLDHAIVNALRFNTNTPVESVMAAGADIGQLLHKYYSKYDESEALEDLKLDPVASIHEGESTQIIEQEAQRKPIVRLLNAILVQGVTRGASDINIRPARDRVNVYYRVDGKLQLARTLHRSLLPALVSRVKITGQMDIAERRLPQDGHARMKWGNRSIDLRISVVPTVNGESVVIRILDKETGLRSLMQLGLPAKEYETILQLISRPHGLFLVTGPTGSGKSTTLYALLNEVKKRNVHILTVEDPVEYDMEGIEQVQISVIKGYTFAEALRHFLRHDPDVIMVGEVRDQETAQIANKAALTGHLVFSTLHTNDAASTVTRLTDMGIEPYLLSSTLLGVMAQRLVRVNCQQCLRPEPIDAVVRRSLGLSDEEVFYRGTGCDVCNKTGYRGRTTVCELLLITPEITALINSGASTQHIHQAALASGMMPLTQSALALARQGRTSLEEVFSVRLEN